MEKHVQYELGDKVKLRSGGPEMTIRGLHYDVFANQYYTDIYDCTWFEKTASGKREVRYSPFAANELQKTEG